METQHDSTTRTSASRMLVGCPECGLPAEIQWQVDLGSTDGPLRHAKLRCLTGHWFFMLADDLAD